MRDTELIGLADRFETPLYIYDLDVLTARAELFKQNLGSRIGLLYAVKANPNPAIIRQSLNWADGLDISSGGELALCLKHGWDSSLMSFAGPGKTDRELTLAVRSGCGSISVESRDDLERILASGARTGKKPRLSLRVNPLDLPGGFALKMGGKSTQFGVDEEQAPEVMKEIAQAVTENRAEYVGIHIYAGTQCLDADALVNNVKNTLRIVGELEAVSGLKSLKVNLGGGFGIPYYDGQDELDIAAAGRGIAAEIEAYNTHSPETKFYIELGRFLVSPAGWYLSRVLAVKASRGKNYAILDGGMHQHLSASGNLGQTIKRNYRMRNLSNEQGPSEITELAGCLCTPIDLLGFGADLPKVRVGDLICIENSGAYGYTSSPLFFLGHDTPREIVLEKGDATIAREAFNLSDIDIGTKCPSGKESEHV